MAKNHWDIRTHCMYGFQKKKMNALQKGELYMKKVNIPNQQDYMNTRFELIQEISILIYLILH